MRHSIFTKIVGSSGPPSNCPSPTTILTQTWDGLGTDWTSQIADNQIPTDIAITADDFSFANGALITDIHWTGGFFNLIEAPTQNFVIQFWSDSGGLPGVVEQVAAFADPTGAPVHIGVVGGNDIYTYSVVLTSNFIALPGVTYWISIQNHFNFPPQWGWATAGVGNGVQNFSDTGFAPIGAALAYDLTGCVAS